MERVTESVPTQIRFMDLEALLQEFLFKIVPQVVCSILPLLDHKFATVQERPTEKFLNSHGYVIDRPVTFNFKASPDGRNTKATVQRILSEQHLQPHKVKYYLDRRDPEFEIKMKDVLMVYQEVMLQNEANLAAATPAFITVSIDEKPGVPSHCEHGAGFVARAWETSDGKPGP